MPASAALRISSSRSWPFEMIVELLVRKMAPAASAATATVMSITTIRAMPRSLLLQEPFMGTLR
jgi:hypothetical protein